MNEPQANESKPPLRNVSRRAFLPALIAGVTGLNFLVIYFFMPEAAPLPDPQAGKPKSRPRFPKHRMKLANLDLNPGFYLNPPSGVIHYVSGGPTAQLKKKEKNGLTPVDPTNTRINATNPLQSKPRVDLYRSSYFFEQAAIAAINEKQIDRASNLLLYAIEFELHSAYRLVQERGFPRFKQSPSFRLYDLLAGISVRFEKQDQLKRMVQLIKDAEDQQVKQSFDSRIKKWEDSNSRWRRRWSDTSKQVSWKVNKGLGLLM